MSKLEISLCACGSCHYTSLSAVGSSTLTERQKAILKTLCKEKLPPSEILEKLDVDISERTLRRELAFLKKQGYVDSEGAQG